MTSEIKEMKAQLAAVESRGARDAELQAQKTILELEGAQRSKTPIKEEKKLQQELEAKHCELKELRENYEYQERAYGDLQLKNTELDTKCMEQMSKIQLLLREKKNKDDTQVANTKQLENDLEVAKKGLSAERERNKKLKLDLDAGKASQRELDYHKQQARDKHTEARGFQEALAHCQDELKIAQQKMENLQWQVDEGRNDKDQIDIMIAERRSLEEEIDRQAKTKLAHGFDISASAYMEENISLDDEISGDTDMNSQVSASSYDTEDDPEDDREDDTLRTPAEYVEKGAQTVQPKTKQIYVPLPFRASAHDPFTCWCLVEANTLKIFIFWTKQLFLGFFAIIRNTVIRGGRPVNTTVKGNTAASPSSTALAEPAWYSWRYILHTPSRDTLPEFSRTLLAFSLHCLLYFVIFIAVEVYNERKLWFDANDATRAYVSNALFWKKSGRYGSMGGGWLDRIIWEVMVEGFGMNPHFSMPG